MPAAPSVSPMTSPVQQASPVQPVWPHGFHVRAISGERVEVKITQDYVQNPLTTGIKCDLECSQIDDPQASNFKIMFHHEPWELVMMYLERSDAEVSKALKTALAPILDGAQMEPEVWKMALTQWMGFSPENFGIALELATEWFSDLMMGDFEANLEAELRSKNMVPEAFAADVYDESSSDKRL